MTHPTTTAPQDVVAVARAAFESGRTRPIAWRRAQLEALIRMLTRHVSEWEAALHADLGKSADETHISELGVVLSEARRARSCVASWARPRPVLVPWELQPACARIRPEPRGVALVLAPWNYPLQLQLAPVVGALAAGCAVVMKPSEQAPATAALLAQLVPEYLDRDAVHVVSGGAEVAERLLTERFDHIFYTGGERVGRLVALAAAKHLTPLVLELGGACPAWVDASADIAVTARRLVWAKFLNAGQTCVAPNHVFVARTVHDELVDAVAAEIRRQFGDDPRRSRDFARLVSEAHFDRVAEHLDLETTGAGTLAVGGESDRGDRYIAPTVFSNVPTSARGLTEEIFGPILPIAPLDTVDEFIAVQRARPTPLAIYGFAARAAPLDLIERQTSSGAFGRNIAVAQLQVGGLPFGGVGASGYGAYRGRRSFEAFSHAKAVLAKPTRPDTLRIAIPPFSPRRSALIRRLITRSG